MLIMLSIVVHSQENHFLGVTHLFSKHVIPNELTMRFTEGGLNVNLKTFSSFEQFQRLCVLMNKCV